ncbi:MAG: hypothetical protein EOP11_14495 [Proteobacteria bacterium]|nr:MAG: hypothetical protein EOP11_14495 [Pseudomonadota bacterium]
MDWKKELEARLADDPRLERKKSRLNDSYGFFFNGKEAVNFARPRTVGLHLMAAGIFALGAKAADERVLEVSKDWIEVRLDSEEDVAFAQKLLESLFREKRGVTGRPKGKTTRKTAGSPKKSKATQAFGDAQALKALRDLDTKK